MFQKNIFDKNVENIFKVYEILDWRVETHNILYVYYLIQEHLNRDYNCMFDPLHNRSCILITCMILYLHKIDPTLFEGWIYPDLLQVQLYPLYSSCSAVPRRPGCSAVLIQLDYVAVLTIAVLEVEGSAGNSQGNKIV